MASHSTLQDPHRTAHPNFAKCLQAQLVLCFPRHVLRILSLARLPIPPLSQLNEIANEEGLGPSGPEVRKRSYEVFQDQIHIAFLCAGLNA